MNKKTHLETQLEEKLESGKKIHLSEVEKERMSTFLSSYMDFNPVIESKAKKKEKSARASFLFRFAVPAFVLALFFVSNRIVVAERALPGDSLYGLKTTVEQVREQLTFSSEAKARLDANLVERRLLEAQTLATEGRLSKDTASDIASRIDAHSAALENSLSALRSRDQKVAALEIDGEHRSTVRVYKNLLNRVSEETDDLFALLEDIGGRSPNLIALQNYEIMSDPTLETPSLENDVLDFEESQDEVETSTESSEGVAVARMFSGNVDDIDLSEEDVGDVLELDVSMPAEVEIRALSLNLDSDRDLDTVEEEYLPIGTFGAFVFDKLDAADTSIDKSRLDKELQKELRSIIGRAFESYELGEKFFESGDEQGARDSFHKALSVAEDIRAAVRVSGKVSQSEVLKSLLDNSPVRIEDKKSIETKIERGAGSVLEKVDDVKESIKDNVRTNVRDLRNNLLR